MPQHPSVRGFVKFRGKSHRPNGLSTSPDVCPSPYFYHGRMAVFVAILVSLLTGCVTGGETRTTVAAEGRADHEIAIIKGSRLRLEWPPFGGQEECLYIEKIEGEETEHFEKTTTVRTLPGPRCITVIWLYEYHETAKPIYPTGWVTSPDTVLCFEAEAGHVYPIKHEGDRVKKDVWRHHFWAVDEADGRIVADTAEAD